MESVGSMMMGIPQNKNKQMAIRNLRNVERPRPLKVKMETNMDLMDENQMGMYKPNEDTILQELEAVCSNLNNMNYEYGKTGIEHVCRMLKSQGHLLEHEHKDTLDRAFISFRNAAQNVTMMEETQRCQLLEVIELRAMGWKTNENMNAYYRRIDNNLNTNNLGGLALQMSASSPAIAAQVNSILSPGEVVKSSGKYPKPTKLPGKTSFKDEIVIRNADSGKVMGMKGRRVHMIEDISNTTISFQRVSSGVKDRLVQIVGPNEDSVNKAKQLVEETIRKNASPVREISTLSGIGSDSSLNSGESEEGIIIPVQRIVSTKQHTAAMTPRPAMLARSQSMSDATLEEYHYTVTVDGRTIKLSSLDAELVQRAKLALEDYFRCGMVPQQSMKEWIADDMKAYGDNLANNNNHMITPSSAKPVARTVECQTSPELTPIAKSSPVAQRQGLMFSPIQDDESNTVNSSDTGISSVEIMSPSDISQGLSQVLPDAVLRYDRQTLLFYSRSPFSRVTPTELRKIYPEYAAVVKEKVQYFNDQEYLLRWEGQQQ